MACFILSLMLADGYHSHANRLSPHLKRSTCSSHDLRPDYSGDEAPPRLDEEVEDGPGVALGKGGGRRNYQAEEHGGAKHQSQHPEA